MSDLHQPNRFAAPVDRIQVAADWSRRGYSCDVFVDPPGRTWTDFVHGTNELVVVTEGRLEITVENVRLVAAPGDEVFIPEGARHSVRNTHCNDTHWLYGYDG